MAWCAGFGRLGGIGGPLVGGLLIAAGLALNSIFYVLVALAVLGAVLTLFAIHRTLWPRGGPQHAAGGDLLIRSAHERNQVAVRQ